MNLTFLCANHRIWLTKQPQQAIHCCYNASETGWFFSQDGRWEEALPYFGSAYETAEILLGSQVIKHSTAIDNFLYTLADLTQTLIKLDRITACKDVYKIAIERIKQEMECASLSENKIGKQIDNLKQELNNLEQGKYKAKSVSNTYMFSNKQSHWNTILH